MKGKKILIIGASSGIGKETAVTLASSGAQLVLMSRNLDKLESLNQELGNNHLFFSVDVTNEEELLDAIERSLEDKVPYDGFVYSAGVEATIPTKLIKKNM